MPLLRPLATLLFATLAVLQGRTTHADEKAPPFPPYRFYNDASQVALSPDGKRLAIIAGLYTRAFVVELDTERQAWLGEPPGDKGRAVSVKWIANDLLAVDLSSGESFSFDVNGKRIAPLGARYLRPLPAKDGAAAWVLANPGAGSAPVQVVNARTGERREYQVDLPGKTIFVAVDALGVLRAVTMRDTHAKTGAVQIRNWYRPDETSPWQLMEEHAPSQDWFIPMMALPEPNRLAVLSRHGRDTFAVMRYDTRTREYVEVMAGHPTEDIDYVSSVDEAVFERVTTSGVKLQVHWFDGRWAGLQRVVDAALPGRINILSGDKHGRVLVYSYGDVEPGRWYLFDTPSSQMREVAHRRTDIDPNRQRPMEALRYAARDGMAIHAYLTRPAGPDDAPAPMVVLVNDGFQSRDPWAWNPAVQRLAASGYAVFQPQVRGSSGFGRRYQEAGKGQLGRAAQDDITDGVAYLVERKIADPKRICIYGSGLGGYAALWGVIKTPALYRCGISFGGVANLADLILGAGTADAGAVAREENGAPGADPDKRTALDEVSPVKHAARAGAPLLIAHGMNDTRIPPAQSEAMVAALKESGKPVQWLGFAGEGAEFTRASNARVFQRAVLTFLHEHLGGALPAAEAETSPFENPPRPFDFGGDRRGTLPRQGPRSDSLR